MKGGGIVKKIIIAWGRNITFTYQITPFNLQRWYLFVGPLLYNIAVCVVYSFYSDRTVGLIKTTTPLHKYFLRPKSITSGHLVQVKMSNSIVSSNFWFLITSITEEQTPVHTPFVTTRLNVAISDLTSRRTGAERPALYFNYNTGNRPTINLIKTFTTQQPLPSPSPSPQQYSRMCLCSVLRQFVAFYNIFTSVLLCPITVPRPWDFPPLTHDVYPKHFLT